MIQFASKNQFMEVSANLLGKPAVPVKIGKMNF
jgi:hypothetical protein